MKKILFILALLFTFVYSNSADAITVVHKDMGYISVNSTASKEIIPDTASVYFTIETSAPDSQSAVNKNKEYTSKVINSLKPLLAIEKSDSIQTKNFILKPVYKKEKNGKKTFLNYTAVNVIFVKTKNLENVSALIDAAVQKNVSNVSGLSFYVENEKQYAGELAQEALSKAKVVAGLTASTLNQQVKGIKSVRVTVYPQNNMQPYVTNELKSSSKKDSQIEYGKVKLEANVNAEFYVK